MIHIDEALLNSVSQKAALAPRRRMNYNFHPQDADPLQRMLNAMEPDTYIQPHKHENPDKREAFFCLKGRIVVVEFTEKGEIADFAVLDPLKGSYGCEVAPRTFHSIISLQAGSVAYEVKDGPYRQEVDKQFAEWAPAEGDPNALQFNDHIINKLGLDR